MPLKGFIKIRRGIEQHLLEGKLGLFDFGVYMIMHLQADYETGIWTGCAERILDSAPRSGDLRAVQRSLSSIEEKAYIKRFRVRGARGNYKVLLDKYEPEFGVLRGYRLNATESNTWKNPKYERVTEDGTDVTLRTHRARTEDGTERAPYPEVRSKIKEKERATPRAETRRFSTPELRVGSGPSDWGIPIKLKEKKNADQKH